MPADEQGLTEPLSYEKVRKQRCEWCAKGHLPRHREHEIFSLEKDQRTIRDYHKETCTAPTLEQFCEEQDATITGLRFQVKTARAALGKAAIALPVLVTMLESAGLDGQSAARVTRDMVTSALAALSTDPSGIGEAVREVIEVSRANKAMPLTAMNQVHAKQLWAALDRLAALGGAK